MDINQSSATFAEIEARRREMNHIRIITRRAGRRIMDGPGESHTACGAPVTDRDMTMSDALTELRRGSLEKWLGCPECRAIAKQKGDRA